jgi:3-oxoacid CoA-transferase subunit A
MPAGNLVYRAPRSNFNPNMATAGKVTVAEVEEISCRSGTLDPEAIHTPGIYRRPVDQEHDPQPESRRSRQLTDPAPQRGRLPDGLDP